MTMLVAQNVWRFYDATPAVQGLDLEVEPGSAYGFIGPNGAGKSTTLRMLATVDRPDAGRVWIQGRDTQHDADRVRRALGFMPDPFGLPDTLSVLEMLEFYAIAYRIPPRERRKRIERVIELTRIHEVRRKKCEDLSKGWRQRVHLAKTMIHDPALLLLDEPASGLDPAARIEFREIVRTLRELGKTIVVSSHILTELADFCDSVGIIEKGRMLVSGRIEDILSRLNPHDRVEVDVLGDPTHATGVLESVPGIDSATASPPRPDGTTRLTANLTGRSRPGDRAALVKRLVMAGVQVTRLETRQEGLEELFLKVAGKLGGEGDAPLSHEMLRTLLGAPRASE